MKKIFIFSLVFFLFSVPVTLAFTMPLKKIETNTIDDSILKTIELEDSIQKTEEDTGDNSFSPLPVKDIKLIEPQPVQSEIDLKLINPDILDKIEPETKIEESIIQTPLKESIVPVEELRKDSVSVDQVNPIEELRKDPVSVDQVNPIEELRKDPVSVDQVNLKNIIKTEEDKDSSLIKPQVIPEDFSESPDLPYEYLENILSPDDKQDEPEFEVGVASFLPERNIELNIWEKKFVINGIEELSYGDSNDDEANKLDIIKLQISSSSKMSEFRVKPAGDCLELHLLNQDGDKINLCSGLKSDAEGVYLSEAGLSARLKTQPDLIYESLKEEAESENAIMEDIELRLVDGRAEYHVSLKEKRRFLGLIPIKVGVSLVVDASSDQITEIKYGFVGKLFKKKNYFLDLKLLPDLIIVDISSYPKSVRVGEKLSIRGRIRNVGNVPSHNPGYGDDRARVILERNGNELNYDFLEKKLNPGEEQMFYLGWKSITCNTELVIRIDPLNKIKELKEDNNDRLYMTTCAPEQAPDLAVKSITYNNNYKRIGANNTVNFTFINQGPVAAPEYTAFYNFEGKSASILVPPLAPQATWSTSRVIKPQRCEPLYLELDPTDAILETNEDNNIFYEPEDITLACKRRADLLFYHCAPWGNEFLPGEEKSFKCTAKNMTDAVKEDPDSRPPDEACLGGFKTSFRVNGQTVASKTHGRIGCRTSGDNYHSDYWLDSFEYKYTPQCQGETVSIVIDPDNSISEGREDNNVWSKTIICAGQLEGAVQ